MIRSILFAAAVTAAAAADAQQLVEQTARGMHRICVYETPSTAGRAQPGGRTRDDGRLRPGTARVQREVGLGEPCPVTDPGPPRQPAATIPSMATLADDRTRSGRRICTYAYAGQRYAREIQVTRRCPLTPHFFD